ncbi:glycerophosphoryl diester phosphodiesterase [Rhizobium laguerreae]|uniref:glycerophosphoryl diester phosphodiesterase n=1 Tax=Rhizobium laguerreae TaxID=1076926 RepID=UPI001C91C0C5|nr:glycerophosphoryl diester phosphodiesterase [Rhizobium laguerreae]MBY3394097.1 glycerophosphoryl diester phosphodiesterase [Rhizobium laguerreae]MBY3493712.1 glycerophosphoryl diester phosphodiesterase [Rhizobium laguerreae]
MTTVEPRSGPRRSEVQAHRGASAIAPENTIAAFRAAAEQGAEWVELDVALLADGTPVVIHDVSIDRCSSSKGNLADLTASDLDAIDAGSWFSPKFKGEPLPTLARVVSALGELGLNANVEIKQHAHHKSLDQLVKVVDQHLKARAAQTKIMISSFDAAALKGMHELDPSYELAMLWSKLPADWTDILRSIPAKTIHLDYKALSIGFIEEAVRRGISVRAWTCNDPRRLASFWYVGLTGVITDDPSVYLT